jgi:DNA-binding transcriptional LysR family regulator
MELRQLRSLVALCESDFNVTKAAQSLHLVQSAVSQHLTRLEDELNLVLFTRQGRRLTGLTTSGEQVLFYARKTLIDSGNILAIGRDFAESSKGVLRIGTTHTQACYVLPPVLGRFRKLYPDINLQIHQGNPRQLVEMVKNNEVDLSICTEELARHPELEALNCYRWNRSLIAPKGHEIANTPPLTLELLCQYPLITYVSGFTGAGHFSRSFARLGLRPDIVLSAADSDVIKTYVRNGFGIGIVVSFAWQEGKDDDLMCLDLSHLFSWEITRIAYNKDKYLRRYEKDFIEIMQQTVFNKA